MTLAESSRQYQLALEAHRLIDPEFGMFEADPNEHVGISTELVLAQKALAEVWTDHMIRKLS